MPNEKSVFDINGTQFPLHDANAVKYDRAQALTDAQKQQARGNIGALGQASIYNGLDKQVLGFALDAYQGKVLNDSKNAVQNGLAIIVDGDTASMAVPVGSYAYIKNNVHGLSEGLYTNTSASAFPASGGMADSTVFTPVSGGGLNAIQQSLAIEDGDGYIKMPNGVLICWGIINIASLAANTFTEAHITFPIAFSSFPALVAIPLAWTNPSQLTCIVKSQFTSNGELRIGNNGPAMSDVKYNWIAIGRWK